jgi:uncharacterized protein YndB with AHSA1/START domain
VNEHLVLVVRRTIRAPVDEVFAAWTRPEHVVRWWGPRPVTCPHAEIDLRVGGSYRIGNLLPDGTTVWISGEFEEIRPDRLVYSWSMEPGAPRQRVTVRFEPNEAGTEVIVVHERIATDASYRSHLEGWEGCLDGLGLLLDPA